MTENGESCLPIVRYCGQRLISKKNTLWIPPAGRRGGSRRVSLTCLADGTVVIGRPFLIPDLKNLRWRDYRDFADPEVLDRDGIPLSFADEDIDEDQYEMFGEDDEPNVYFADGDGPVQASGEENGDMTENKPKTDGSLKKLLGTMADSLREAVASIESCIALMAAFTDQQTP